MVTIHAETIEPAEIGVAGVERVGSASEEEEKEALGGEG